MNPQSSHGADRVDHRTWRFAVWAPEARSVSLGLEGPVTDRRPVPADASLADGWYSTTIEGIDHGQRYRWVIDGQRRADPASRWQPDGVHGPSAAVDPRRFEWTDDAWTGLDDLGGQVLYELHVGTFTPAGTFDAVVEHLDRLASTGVTAIELMPIAQFPGHRNWGYDGVLPCAAQDTYGGPEGLARLVDASHASGLGVLLDVVYNHLGPEGNHLRSFGPYFTDTYATPWGEAVNFAEAGSDEVRKLFIDSARQWIRDHHVDGFRLDAVHAIVDPTARPFLEELTESVHAEATRAGRAALVIAESSANDPRLVRPPERGGYGMDGVWHDEVHHAVRVAVTGEAPGYYADFTGVDDLVATLERNVVFDGRFSTVRGRRHGRPAPDVPACRFVVYDQNHDQVGNRAFGERLDVLVGAARRRVAAAVVALGPFTPMLFMGEEYGETAPFPYFVNHSDAELLEAVRRGRREEFASFEWDEEPPDPGAESTFTDAVLDHDVRDESIEALWIDLLSARRDHPTLWHPAAAASTARVDDTIIHHRQGDPSETLVAWNLGADTGRVDLPGGRPWMLRLNTTDDPPAAAPRELAAAHADELDLAPWSAVLLTR